MSAHAVDVHAHYYPTPYLDRIGRADLPPPAALLGRQSVAERLDLLDALGIEIQVLSVSQAQPYLPRPDEAADAAKLGNDLFLELCQAHPDRFRLFAALPLPHVDSSLAELERVAREPAVVGVTIGCSVAGLALDDPGLEPVWAELDRRQTPVFLHPVGHEDWPWLAPYNLAWLVGAPFEDTVAALRLILSGTLDRFPRLRVVVPHLGGTIPFLAARLRRQDVTGRLAEGLRRLYVDTVSGDPRALTAAADTFGSDHLLLGTDYPYGTAASLRQLVDYLAEGGLDAGAVAAIRHGTARQLLRL